MNIIVSCANSITSKTWVETEMIECIYELFNIRTILIPKGENVGRGNNLVEQVVGLKYNVEKFPNSFSEFGLGAIHKRNQEMFSKADFFLALTDGHSKSIDNMINLALRKKIGFNVRYINKYYDAKLK